MTDDDQDGGCVGLAVLLIIGAGLAGLVMGWQWVGFVIAVLMLLSLGLLAIMLFAVWCDKWT